MDAKSRRWVSQTHSWVSRAIVGGQHTAFNGAIRPRRLRRPLHPVTVSSGRQPFEAMKFEDSTIKDALVARSPSRLALCELETVPKRSELKKQ